MENNEVVQKCGPKLRQKSNFRTLLPYSPAYLNSQGKQGCLAKARENSNSAKILVHTFVQPHCCPFDVTLFIFIKNMLLLSSLYYYGQSPEALGIT